MVKIGDHFNKLCQSEMFKKKRGELGDLIYAFVMFFIVFRMNGVGPMSQGI